MATSALVVLAATPASATTFDLEVTGGTLTTATLGTDVLGTYSLGPTPSLSVV